MNNTIYIVLGVLVGVVVIFLIVTQIVDKKKRDKIKKLKKETLEKINKSAVQVAKDVSKILDLNKKRLKNFVPALGNTKMSDINQEAKNKLLKIKNSPEFKLIASKESAQKKIKIHLDILIKNRSNNWEKKYKESCDFFRYFVLETPEEKKTTQNSPQKWYTKLFNKIKMSMSKNKKIKNEKKIEEVDKIEKKDNDKEKDISDFMKGKKWE